MKIVRFLFSLLAAVATAALAEAQSNAPTTDIADTYFTGTLTGSTGGANADGTLTDFFSAAGLDYTVNANGSFSNPVAYVYANTGANTGTITEGALVIALTFTNPAGGTFLATYGASVTQTGTFAINTTAAEAPLGDVSCLTTLQPAGTATVGFYIGGSVPHTVLIRAVGPGLATFGVTGMLATPSLTLWKQGTPIATGGSTTAALQTVYNTLGAFTLPVGSADAVIQTTVGPGAYTAQVTGTSATTAGQVLIEVYYLN
jgi:hypothetical protein